MSDQDFFFDEDEKPAAKPAAKSGSAKGSGSSKATPPASSGSSSQAPGVTMTVAVLIGIIGVLLGVAVGLFIGKSMAVPVVASSTSVLSPTPGTSSGAPQLTQEQINSGQLPAGHPQVGAGTGSVPTTTGK